MEINNLQLNSISAYKKVTRTSSVKKNSSSLKSSVNTDKVEFNFGRSLAAAQTAAAMRTSAPVSEERLAALAEKYAGDNCPVSAEAVAEAIIA
ncbi:MAG: hypothetical protein IJT87_06550 [Ruminiclostridium sp.]|nr:hypothetical protein [Ruminiclostridium sp.]